MRTRNYKPKYHKPPRTSSPISLVPQDCIRINIYSFSDEKVRFISSTIAKELQPRIIKEKEIYCSAMMIKPTRIALRYIMQPRSQSEFRLWEHLNQDKNGKWWFITPKPLSRKDRTRIIRVNRCRAFYSANRRCRNQCYGAYTCCEKHHNSPFILLPPSFEIPCPELCIR